MIHRLHALLWQGLPALELQVNDIIKAKITNRNQIDRLLDVLLDYAQIDEGLLVFKRLCQYTYLLYPDLTVSHINYYRDLYDDTYTPPDSVTE
jgi:hypothetical protein